MRRGATALAHARLGAVCAAAGTRAATHTVRSPVCTTAETRADMRRHSRARCAQWVSRRLLHADSTGPDAHPTLTDLTNHRNDIDEHMRSAIQAAVDHVSAPPPDSTSADPSDPDASLYLAPVIFALMEAALEAAEAASTQSWGAQRLLRTRRCAPPSHLAPADTEADRAVASTDSVVTETIPTEPAPPEASSAHTLYEHLCLSSSSHAQYVEAPVLFRKLMRIAATFPVGHLCKDVVAATYSWSPFVSLLSLSEEVYTIAEDDGVVRLEGPDAADEEEASDDYGTHAPPPTPALTALRDDFRRRFWVLCSPAPEEVLALSGVTHTTAAERPPVTSLPCGVAPSRLFLARRHHPDSPRPPPLRLCTPLCWRSASTSPPPDPRNLYNGWGSALSVPRVEDVRTILAYIPVNWGNLGTLAIPSEVRKKHIRSSSPLQWFRRQPFYFEVRDMNGTTEVRRSIVLHPEAHGLTREEAMSLLQLRMAENSINHLVPLLPDGTVAAPTADGASLSTHSAAPAMLSAAERATLKFFKRVCPGYFTPLSLVVQRATKKSIDEPTLLRLAESRPDEFELLRCRYSDVPLVRRCGVGVDASHWREAFVQDLERQPEDVAGLIAVMGCLCPNWDRPEYVFVRLSHDAQRAVKGYDGMLELMRRHPAVFRCGEHHVCRVDPSDPVIQQQPEPALGEVSSRVHVRPENPYLSVQEVAKVLHYVAPEDESFTPAYLVERASPAMHMTLPSRIVTLLQLFPELFVCVETAPGVFNLRKISKRGRHEEADGAGSGGGDAMASDGAGGGDEGVADEDEAEDHSWMRDAAAEEGTLLSHSNTTSASAAGPGAVLSRAAVVEAVRLLVPTGGVDSAQLLLWSPLPVQRAASQYYGGVVKLVEAETSVFRVDEGPDASKRVFLTNKS